MQRRVVFTAAVAVAMGFALGTVTVANARTLGSGPHYNLNIIGFSHCTMTADGVYPDCFKGNAGPSGHVIFVPLKTSQTQDICATPDPIVADPADDACELPFARRHRRSRAGAQRAAFRMDLCRRPGAE